MLLFSLLLGVLGLILGSFIAALAVRWPEGRSVMRGRSACDACGVTLRPVELVPLLSAVLQRGRCRSCGARIAAVHWQVEVGAAVVGASAGWIAPGLEGVAGAVFGWLLLALAVLDLRAFWLPNWLTGALALAGVASWVAGFAPDWQDRAIGGGGGFVLLWIVARSYRRLRGRNGMGGGDPNLFGAIGLWLGWQVLPPVLLIASMTGLAVALTQKVRGKNVTWTDELPLGALLAIAAYPAWWMMVAYRP